MKSALRARIGLDKIKEMATYLCDREGVLKREMENWRAKRLIFSAYMENDFSSRQGTKREEGKGTDNIFDLSNESMGLVRSAILFTTARTREDIFGSSPWLAAKPVGLADNALADNIQRHLPWKIDQSNFQESGEEGIERCFNLGESILKHTWRRDAQTFHRYANVRTDPKNKEKRPTGKRDVDDQEETIEFNAPVLTETGDYIFDTDAEHEREVVPGAEGAPPTLGRVLPPADPSAPEAPEQPAGQTVRVSAKDPDVILHDHHEFESYLIPDEVVHYEGLDVSAVDFRQFRCRMDVARLEDSDFRGHVYQARLSDLRKRMGENWDDESREIFERIKNGGDSSPKTDEKRAGTPARGDDENPTFACMDVEFERDPEGEGNTTWFYATVLMESQEIIFADYLANVTPKGQSMFSVSAINSPFGCWHGRGWYELYWQVMQALDKHFNLVMYRNAMSSNPIAGVNPEAIEEDLEEIDLVPGYRVTLKPGKTLKDFIEFLQMPNLDQNTWQIIEMMIKLFQLETGVTSAAQGGLGDMPATNTATGIQSVLSSGATLQKRPTAEIRRGLEDGLKKSAKIIYLHQNQAETFAVGEGENRELATLDPAQVAGMEIDVTLTLTRFRQREDIENAMACLNVAQQYLALPESEKAAQRPLYIQILKGHGIDNADAIIREPIPVDPNATQGQAISESLAIKFSDLPPKAKAIVMKQVLGIDLTEQDFAEPPALEKKAA